MLVLSRKTGESIVIGREIVVTLVELRGDKCRIAVKAPREVSVHRSEVFEAIHGADALQKILPPSPPPFEDDTEGRS